MPSQVLSATAPIIDVSFSPSPILLAEGFNDFALSFRSFKEPLKRSIQEVVAPSLQQNFDVGGRPTPWIPLAETTLERRSKRGYGSKPLKRSGRLQRTAGQLNIWKINGPE